MATVVPSVRMYGMRFMNTVAAVLLWSMALGAAMAQTADKLNIAAPALFEGRAMLVINGERRILKAGDISPEGVELVSANSKQAVIKINNEERIVKLGSKISSVYKERGKLSISLSPVQGGHYIAGGSINGHAVEFLVDTGATNVVVNQVLAERLGLRYKEGVSGRTATAAGVVDSYEIVLERVRLGDLEVRGIAANVLAGDSPHIVLLGNSFLNRMDIIREGAIMKIIER